MDVYSRRIVGWSMPTRLKIKLVEDALHIAVGQREHDDDRLHHSDRGSQDTNRDNQTLLSQAQLSGTGNGYDNAMMESFFATLKTECADHRFATRTEARQASSNSSQYDITDNVGIQPSFISHRRRLSLCHRRQLWCPPNSGKSIVTAHFGGGFALRALKQNIRKPLFRKCGVSENHLESENDINWNQNNE